MKLLNYFDDWTIFEKCWLATFSLINIYLFYVWQDTVIGLIASLTGMMCVILVAKGKILNYYFGIINVILYAYIAYQSKFYGEVSLNILYFLPMQFVGLYYWKATEDKIKNKGTVVLQKLSTISKVAWLGTSAFAVVGYWFILKLMGGNLPFADSISTVLSVFAMILMVKRVSEQWILWIIVDIVSIYMWVKIFFTESGDISMIIMWSAFLVNAIYGYYNWNRMVATK